MYRPFLSILALAATTFLLGPLGRPLAAEDEAVLKIATLAPGGSTWMKVLGEADLELRRETGSKAGLKFYAGGILGDELTVLSKIESGKIDGAAFTGLGLERILPEMRVLELPLLFASYEEFDHVKAGILPDLERRFEEKGWKLLGVAEAGFAHFFSRTRFQDLEGLRRTRVWSRADDALTAHVFRAFSIPTRETPLSEVAPLLAAQELDTVYTSPLGLIAFQWFERVRYRVALDLFNLEASLVVRLDSYERIDPAHRATFDRVAAKYVGTIVARTREDNAESLRILTARGIESIELEPASRRAIEEAAERLGADLAGKSYDQAFYERVLELRRQYREGD